MRSDTHREGISRCNLPECPKPVWRDPDGTYSAYCSRSHRNAITLQYPSVIDLCKNCLARPVYVLNGAALQFCGKRCKLAFSTGHKVNREDSILLKSSATCTIVGCDQKVFVHRDGNLSEFCSNSHRLLAVGSGEAEACLRCRKWPKALFFGKRSDFCSQKCADTIYSSAPHLSKLYKSDKEYHEVTTRFETTWLHESLAPSVIAVWKIFTTKNIYDTMNRYKLSVERERNLLAGNTQLRWHGTVRACRLGDTDTNNTVCQSEACSLCQIIMTSFRKAKAGQRTNFGRFGKGIYTSATSSKADDYALDRELGQFKAMLLNEVVIGRTVKLTESDTSLTKPPNGYDSVTGVPGGDLNYDECIVYQNDAIRPLYLVIYKNPWFRVGAKKPPKSILKNRSVPSGTGV
ncbi:ADP-ribosylation [Panus rudis PR-1116 ss-1]|nr:ADP-ribosylation [Panus rudis PR-1116 ss-1]